MRVMKLEKYVVLDGSRSPSRIAEITVERGGTFSNKKRIVSVRTEGYAMSIHQIEHIHNLMIKAEDNPL